MSGPSAPSDEPDDTRRRFREALDAKKGQSGEDHRDGSPSPVRPHGPVAPKRVFRRKSG